MIRSSKIQATTFLFYRSFLQFPIVPSKLNLQFFLPGIFRERQRIEPEYAWSPRTNLEHRAIILVGVFNLDPGYSYGLERSWRDVTGARTIYHHLHNEHDLCRILFLERTNKSSEINLFAYLVVVECRCVASHNQQRILDFVAR